MKIWIAYGVDGGNDQRLWAVKATEAEIDLIPGLVAASDEDALVICEEVEIGFQADLGEEDGEEEE